MLNSSFYTDSHTASTARERSSFAFFAKLVALVSLFSLSPLAVSDEYQRPVFKGTSHDNLFDISMEGEQGIAVGEYGLVVETSNGGKEWVRKKSLTDLSLFSVVRKQGKCLAVGQLGGIYNANDCVNWKQVDSGTKSRLLEVDMNSKGLAFAVGGFGEILKSSDAGETWQSLLLDWDTLSDGIEPHLYTVHVSESGVVTLAGEFELILRSQDGGVNWQAIHQGEKSIFATHFLPSGEGYAVGQEGLVLKTRDNGMSWQVLDTPTESILTSVWANKEGTIQVSGVNTLLHSTDGGESFYKPNTLQSGWYQAVAVDTSSSEGNKVIVVGSGASIYAFDLAQNKNISKRVPQ